MPPNRRQQVMASVASFASMAYAVAQGRHDIAAAMGRLLASRAMGQPDPPGDAELVAEYGQGEALRLRQQAQVAFQREGARLTEQLNRFLNR